MPLGEKKLAAAWFIPRTTGERAFAELAEAAGTQDLFLADSHPDPLHGSWAGMEDCSLRLDVLKHHYCLQIYFWLSAFPERTQGPVEQDGAIRVAYAFRKACEQLRAEAAFIVTHLDQANPSYILDQYRDVLGMNANILVNRHFGLLYLSADLVSAMDAGARLSGRDTLPVLDGLLVFSGQGGARWY